MAEGPLAKLGRLVGGVAMMQGRLGHQVLGQLLVLGARDVEVAGATVVLAATSRHRSAIGQAAIRTGAPAVAVAVWARRQEKRLERQEKLLEAREQAVRDQKAEN